MLGGRVVLEGLPSLAEFLVAPRQEPDAMADEEPSAPAARKGSSSPSTSRSSTTEPSTLLQKLRSTIS